MHSIYKVLFLWGIKNVGPVFGRDITLLVDRSRDITDDVHPSPCGATAANEFRPAQCLIACCSGNIILVDIEVTHLIDKERL